MGIFDHLLADSVGHVNVAFHVGAKIFGRCRIVQYPDELTGWIVINIDSVFIGRDVKQSELLRFRQHPRLATLGVRCDAARFAASRPARRSAAAIQRTLQA